MSSSTSATKRVDRRRARTRAALVDAGRRLVADRGVEALTIAEIAEEADVGFGTFYNYFGSKEDLVRAVVADFVERIGVANDVLTAGLDDPADVVAVSISQTIALVTEDPVWARFLVRVTASPEGGAVWLGLWQRMARDLRAGTRTGRFTAKPLPVVAHLIGGGVMAAVRGMLEGSLSVSAAPAVTTHALRLLGIPDEEAAYIAARPLPHPPIAPGGASP